MWGQKKSSDEGKSTSGGLIGFKGAVLKWCIG